jgi:4-hydroxy-2-oxoheptanedioate aldolase
MLCAGAYGIICQMVNSKAEAKAFVSAARYPPLRVRSAGSFRASQYGGPDYIEHDNDEILLLAVIETRQAIDNFDSILSVQGLDGVFVGPSDLALSRGKPATLDPTNEKVRKEDTRQRLGYRGTHRWTQTAAKRYAEGSQFPILHPLQ